MFDLKENAKYFIQEELSKTKIRLQHKLEQNTDPQAIANLEKKKAILEYIEYCLKEVVA